jgi:two-component system, response regulator YesN
MITLLLVEDETEVREGLKKFIPWDSIGIDKIEEAIDGLAAIGLCESIRPDILLTDIRMPKMDGIQLAIYIRERFPLCRIIFISGYSDKDYLKSAIKVGAVSYIDKPVDIQELQQVLAQTVIQCRQDLKKKEEQEYLGAISKAGYPLILQKLAASACYNGQEGMLLASHLDILSSCAVVTLTVKLHEDAALSEEEGEYFRNSIIAFINESDFRTEEMKLAAFFLDRRTLVIHCFFPGHTSNATQNDLITDFLADLNQNYDSKYVFTAVAGKSAKDPLGIPDSFKSAQRMVKILFYRPKGTLHTTFGIKNSEFELTGSFVNEFDKLILNGRLEETHVWLDRLEQSILQHPMTEIGYIKNIYFNIYEQIASAAKKRYENISLIEEEYTYIWQALSMMETLYDITQFFHSMINSYFNIFDKTDLTVSVIQDIKEYIKIHFCDSDLSIKKIAEIFHYDYYYLCSLFKKKTDITINTYISQVRVEKAIELLKERHVTLHEITNLVGYNDPSYFTKLFKKYAGVTPSEYREKH